jgi:hypothetical protein
MVFAHLVNPPGFFVHEIQPIWISLRPLRQDHGNHLFPDITLKALPDFLMRIRRAFRYSGQGAPVAAPAPERLTTEPHDATDAQHRAANQSDAGEDRLHRRAHSTECYPGERPYRDC